MVFAKVEFCHLYRFIFIWTISPRVSMHVVLAVWSVINHLMYADDLVIFSPCTAGLQQLLSLCTQYGMKYDITYNAKKSNILILRSRSFQLFIYLALPSVNVMRLNTLDTLSLMIFLMTKTCIDNSPIYLQTFPVFNEVYFMEILFDDH